MLKFKFMGYVPVLCLAVIFTVLTSCAYAQAQQTRKPPQTQTIPEPGTRGTPESITIYGNTYKIIPYQMSHIAFTWHDVKSQLPEEIFKTPEQPLSDQDVLNKLETVFRESLEKYDALVERLGKQFIEKHPGSTPAYVEREIAGRLHGNFYAKIYPEIQDVHNRYVALNYLNEMIRETLGLGSPRY